MYYAILHYMVETIELHNKSEFESIDQSKIIKLYIAITKCREDINRFKKFRELYDYERNTRKRKASYLFMSRVYNEMLKFIQQQIHEVENHKLQPSSVFKKD